MTADDTPLRLVPVDDDVDTGGFFDAARDGKLAIRRCNECDNVLHVPRQHCRFCGSWSGRWAEVDGAATLYTWTVVEHQVHPAYPVPYTVIVVDLDELPGTRLMGMLDGRPDLTAGMAMEVWFDDLGEVDGRRVVMPQFRPAGSANSGSQ